MIFTVHFLQRNWSLNYHGIYHFAFLIFWLVLCFVGLFYYVCLIPFPTWDSHIVFLYVAAVWAWGGFAVPTGWFAPHSLDTSIAWCTRETDRCGQASGSRGQVAPHESTEQSWINKIPARNDWHWHSKYTHLCYRLVYFINILRLVCIYKILFWHLHWFQNMNSEWFEMCSVIFPVSCNVFTV